MDASHEHIDFARAVIEGSTFSLNESIETFRESGKTIDTIISIGVGAKTKLGYKSKPMFLTRKL